MRDFQSHCLKCGMVSQTTFECADKDPFPIVNGKDVPPFGLWLRASGLHLGSYYLNQRGKVETSILSKDLGRSGKVSDNVVSESMLEGESSQKIRALVNVSSVDLEKSDMAGGWVF